MARNRKKKNPKTPKRKRERTPQTTHSIFMTLVGETEIWEHPDDLDAAMAAKPWLREFFSGYCIGFQNLLMLGQLTEGAEFPTDVAADDPQVFAIAGGTAAREDARAFVIAGDRRLLNFVAFTDADEQHKAHWDRFKERPEWLDQERRWSRFDRRWEDNMASLTAIEKGKMMKGLNEFFQPLVKIPQG